MDALQDNAFVLRLALSNCSGASFIDRVFDTALDAVGGYDTLVPYKKIKSINFFLGRSEKISLCMDLLGRSKKF